MSMRERDDGRRWSERGIAMIRCMSVTTADQYAAHAARLDRFLSEQPVVWLSTVRPDGAPHLVPIWFTWDGASLLVFSKPGAQKVRNMRANPVAMLALGEPEDDFDVAMAEARVELLDEPATELPWAHLAKYSARMASMGLSPDQFVAIYSQVIRITPTRTVPWHGRSTPRSLRNGGSDGRGGRWTSLVRAVAAALRPAAAPVSSSAS
jgi:PPOX class probable F420-dependent enzyme